MDVDGSTISRATGTTQEGPSRLSSLVLAVSERLCRPEYTRRVAEAEAREAAIARVRRSVDAEALWTRRGRRYRACRLETFEIYDPKQRKAVAACRQYAASVKSHVANGVNVLLVGPSGTGKDHLLACLVHAALAADVTVEWETGATMWLGLRQAIQTGREREWIASLVRPWVLVLSDPIAPHSEVSQYDRSVLYAIIDQRYSKMRPVWLSINASSRAEAEQRLGVAIVDRLRHGALSLACDWPSYRGKLRSDT